MVRILEASPRRVAAKCPVYGECGGCALQHASYDLQLEIKTTQVRELLRRFAKLPEAPVDQILPSPAQWAYRNRISIHLDRQRVGFFHRKSRDLVDIDHCPLASEEVNALLADFRKNPPHGETRLTLRETGAPRGFSQVNTATAELLAATVIEMCGTGELLVDAYCGSGFFAKHLLEKFQKITGLEWSQGAVAEAKRSGTTLLVDPPAEGLSPDVARAILENPPAKLVYVSCDPATFSRDAAKFLEPYTLSRVQPVDMFPQTAEIEVAALFLLA
jgi:23S rRNA (uracil1939-C5)-methyltransferase